MKEYTDKQELIKKISDTSFYIEFNWPFEKIFRGDINLDDFSTVFQDAIEKYRKTIISIIKSQPVVTQAGFEHNYDNCHNATCRRQNRMNGAKELAEKLKEKIDDFPYGYDAISNDFQRGATNGAKWIKSEVTDAIDKLLKEMGVL